MFLKNIIPKRDWPHLFKNQLSWFLVPIILILWFLLPFSHNILTNTMISIVLIGIIECIFYLDLTITSNILNIIGHGILLIPIFLVIFPYTLLHKIFKNYNHQKNQNLESILVINKSNKSNKTNKPKKSVKFSNKNEYYYNENLKNLTRFNIWSFILLIIVNIVIIKLPYWPYVMTRDTMMIYYNFIVISLWLLNLVN